jgi:hypothetical protein
MAAAAATTTTTNNAVACYYDVCEIIVHRGVSCFRLATSCRTVSDRYVPRPFSSPISNLILILIIGDDKGTGTRNSHQRTQDQPRLLKLQTVASLRPKYNVYQKATLHLGSIYLHEASLHIRGDDDYGFKQQLNFALAAK